MSTQERTRTLSSHAEFSAAPSGASEPGPSREARTGMKDGRGALSLIADVLAVAVALLALSLVSLAVSVVIGRWLG